MNFAAILDKNYIPRLNTLLYSLLKHESKFNFYVIALDDETYHYFKAVENCIPISINEIHSYYPELDNIEKERDRVSYIFTLSPFYPSYILEKYPDLDHICSLDSDQFFFSTPKVIFDLLDRYSVLITPHRFSPKLKELDFERFGKFNVSFQVFKNNQVGKQCLKLWREQCFNWCFDKEENGWYADQKYLNVWQDQFGEQVHEIQHVGLGLAPWNIEDVTIEKRGKEIIVDQQLLILYHYQGLKVLDNGFVYTFIDNYSIKSPSTINQLIYHKIIKSLLKFTSKTDTFSRNNRKFDFHFLTKKADFVFKIKFGIIFDFNTYLKIQKLKNGIFNRFNNIFRR
jgi:hypothetical protein